MQAYPCKFIVMQRDMDLIRDLLLHIDADPKYDGSQWFHPERPEDLGISNHSFAEVTYHLNLLIETELIRGMPTQDLPMISRLTAKGHDFVDDIRDNEIWSKTKARAKGIASIGISFIWEIAKAEIRTKFGLP